MRKIVFDLETKNFFNETGNNDPKNLELSIICIHDSETNSYHSFFEKDLPRLWSILERADLLIGYNSEHFDLPILNKYYPGDLSKIRSVDLLKEIRRATGRRLSLNQIAHGTLGKKKSGYGGQAVEWWKKGNLDALREYCIDDVKLTKEIYEYGLAHDGLKYSDRGALREVKLDTSSWKAGESSGLTFSLPF